KNANGVFLSILVWIPRLGREGFVFFNNTADGLAGGRRVLSFSRFTRGNDRGPLYQRALKGTRRKKASTLQLLGFYA
ncbi:hypothetical protein, partial [Coxiella burnetii]|uniref:hypothetical protein n=1 Tax=Coxiella burnetii TaxID=777 RepID=UPI003D9FE8BE